MGAETPGLGRGDQLGATLLRTWKESQAPGERMETDA